MLWLLWRREAQGGDEDMDGVDQGGGELDAPPPPLRGVAPHATTARVGINLDPRVLVGEEVQKGARGWTRATVHKFLRDVVAPADPSSFANQEAGVLGGGCARGRWCYCWRWQGRW